MPFTTRKPSKRKPDAESRKPRVSTQKFARRLPPPEEHPSDSDEHISSDTDSELETKLGMTVKDDSRVKTFRPKEPRKQEQKDTAQQTALHSSKESESSEKAITQAPHMIIRACVYHIKVAPITFPQVSTYVPSFYQFYFVLNAAHNIVSDNTYLKHLCPYYVSIASSLYYGILGFLQILRSKSVAGIITKPEQQVLGRFEREFPFENLPVMSPLIMFFQNLGAVKLADPMFTWICPTIPETIGTPPNTVGIFASSDNIMLPNVPALIRFLHELGTANQIADVTQDNRIVPASRTAGNNNFFGINLAANQQNNAVNQRLIYSAGWTQPPELPDFFSPLALRRIGRWNLPQLGAATDLVSIVNFIQAGGNLEWFNPLQNMCTEESKFFLGSTKFSEITPTTGLSSLIETRHSDQTAPAAVDSIYPFWNQTFNSDLWRFDVSTTRGETTQDEIKIGATTQFLISSFGNLTPPQHALPQPALNGPYFGAPAQGRQVQQIESDVTRSPKLAFEQIIRENLYDQTGGQNKPSTT